MNFFKHLATINKHKKIVMQECFKVGLYRQGLLHDLSKYSWTEFRIGLKYYQGNRSPNNAEREVAGLSTAWLHHKGRNKHHYEYWIDYSLEKDVVLAGMEMPIRYVVEMFLDRVAASKVYRGVNYVDRDPLNYFMMGKEHYLMHPRTRALLEKLLKMLDERGEEVCYKYIRENLIGRRVKGF